MSWRSSNDWVKSVRVKNKKMDIDVENEGHYPSYTRYDKDLWRHMILNEHLDQMKSFHAAHPTIVLWDESSMALAAEIGDVETLIFLRDECKCPVDAEATYNALLYCNYYALLYLLMSECDVDFTHEDIDEVERYENATADEGESMYEVRNVVDLARQALASR